MYTPNPFNKLDITEEEAQRYVTNRWYITYVPDTQREAVPEFRNGFSNEGLARRQLDVIKKDTTSNFALYKDLSLGVHQWDGQKFTSNLLAKARNKVVTSFGEEVEAEEQLDELFGVTRRNINPSKAGFLEPKFSELEQTPFRISEGDKVAFKPEDSKGQLKYTYGIVTAIQENRYIVRLTQLTSNSSAALNKGDTIPLSIHDIDGVKHKDTNVWYSNNGSEYEKIWSRLESVNEDRTLNDNAASMIERATGICMEVWYSLTQTFHAQSDKYDPDNVNPSDKFMHFQLAPGGDARDDAYKKLIDATEKLCDQLNDALGRGGLFTPEIIRKDGHLECRAKYAEGKGGIFHVKTKEQDVGIGITMTMPRQGVIRDAFKSLVTTPEFPIGDEIPEPEKVVPDRPSDMDAGEGSPAVDGMNAPDRSLGQLGGVNVVGEPDDQQLSYRKESLNEGKRSAEGYSTPPERGFYVVYGDQAMLNDAKYFWKGYFDKMGVSLPGRAYQTKEDAIAAKNQILQNLRSNGRRNSGFGKFHVKQWDGQEYHAINIPQTIGYQRLDDPIQSEPAMDDAPLDNDVEPEEDNFSYQSSVRKPNAELSNYVNRYKKARIGEEVAANAVGGGNGGAWKSNSPSNPNDPYDATRNARSHKASITRRKTNEMKAAVKRWEEASPFSLSGGSFNK